MEVCVHDWIGEKLEMDLEVEKRWLDNAVAVEALAMADEFVGGLELVMMVL